MDLPGYLRVVSNLIAHKLQTHLLLSNSLEPMSLPAISSLCKDFTQRIAWISSCLQCQHTLTPWIPILANKLLRENLQRPQVKFSLLVPVTLQNGIKMESLHQLQNFHSGSFLKLIQK